MPAEPRRRVLITRPAEDAQELAQAVAGLGLEPVIEPLLRIVPTGAALALDDVQALLLTSANGVRALAAATSRRDLTLLAVGDATAAAARGAGFAQVESAGGDAVALAALVRARCRPQAGPLLHVSGRDVAGDLAQDLSAAGFALRRAVLYRAETATSLSPALRDLLAQERIAAALFLSPRTARSFVTLVETAHLAAACRPMAAFCLSAAVAAALTPLALRTLHVAAAPNRPALCAALAAWAAEQDRGMR